MVISILRTYYEGNICFNSLQWRLIDSFALKTNTTKKIINHKVLLWQQEQIMNWLNPCDKINIAFYVYPRQTNNYI